MTAENQIPIPRFDLYPSRSKRNCMIASIQPKTACCIAGRVFPMGNMDLRIVDRSGSIPFKIKPVDEKYAAGTDYQPSPGDLAELDGRLSKDCIFQAERCRLLSPGRTEPPPSSANASLWALEKNHFVERSKMKEVLRDFFLQKGFEEVDTPVLVSAPGQEPFLDPFRTMLDCEDHPSPRYLITSPEYAHKRLLAAGFEKIFEIARVFRNGPSEMRGLHHPEFTMVEWYRAYASYLEIMEDVEALVYEMAEQSGSDEIDLLKPPFERITMAEAFHRYTNLDLGLYFAGDPSFAGEEALQGRYGLKPEDDSETRYFKIFIAAIEPKLGDPKPAFLLDFPADQASLSKRKNGRPEVCERFELYIHGVELANGFTELNDPDEQAARFKKEASVREKRGEDPIPQDSAFLEALYLGMPPSGGVALGFDRLLMVLQGHRELKKILPFFDG